MLKAKQFTVHGIDFKRTGVCDRCPNTQPAPCCLDCPHFDIKDGVNTCLIYDTRGDKCVSCSQAKGKDVNHSVCIDFPDHPFLNVLHKKQCSCSFDLVRQTDSVKLSKLSTKYGNSS